MAFVNREFSPSNLRAAFRALSKGQTPKDLTRFDLGMYLLDWNPPVMDPPVRARKSRKVKHGDVRWLERLYRLPDPRG